MLCAGTGRLMFFRPAGYWRTFAIIFKYNNIMSYISTFRSGVLLLLLALTFSRSATAADSLRVLFIGNSYTAVNNLPQVFKDMAASAGQVIITDENMPGGYTFMQHSTNATTLSKMEAGNWDYIVFQEQSQYPSFPDGQVAAEVMPYARFLDSFAKAKNPCVQTVFYMTWGRKNGDAANCPGWPPVCTYEGMDSLLRKRYIEMAQENGAVVSPVGAVWRYLRGTTPALELYATDESHPSFAGTYAAACAFYVALLRKDLSDVTYTGSLSPAVAEQIKAAANTVVFDSLDFWRENVTDPAAAFTLTATGAAYTFTNTSEHADSYQWFFGDGSSATTEDAAHTFTADGSYEIMLVASHCKVRDTARQTVVVDAATGVAQYQPVKSLSFTQQGQTLWLQSQQSIDAAQVSLYNLSGQKVAVANWKNGRQMRINIAALPAGTYVIVVQERAGTQTLKVSLR